jgi:ADP-ribosylglycohydrolase
VHPVRRARRVLVGLLLAVSSAAAEPAPPAGVDVAARIHGLLLGGYLGDALGGPVEFQDAAKVQALPDPPRRWADDEILDAPARAAAAARLRLRPYAPLRPVSESYGQWGSNCPPGTVTDDSRHKLILLHALRAADAAGAWPLDVRALARAHLDWPARPAIATNAEFRAQAADWLEEWQLAARWVLGERDPARALPPERMWQGLPTCCGQMTLPPLAAVFAGRPDDAHRAAYHLAFFDNGFGRDLNAALVAALAAALVTPSDPGQPRPAWEAVLAALRETDPYRHRKIRWSQRAVDRWLDFALRAAREAEGRPARMFAVFEQEFRHSPKWEAQVPFTVAFGCLALAEFEPLPALQLALEWGHDTDSYAQLLGAFIGALFGPEIFPAAMREAVAARLAADFGEDVAAQAALLDGLRRRATTARLVAAD